jgi:hypothetical protein
MKTVIRRAALSILLLIACVGASCPKRCPTTANLWVGINPEKPGPGSTVLICPGEPVGLVWATEHAQSVSIDNDIGDVEPSGSKILNPTQDTRFTLTAVGQQCTRQSSVFVNVITDGDSTDLTLHRPPKDKDTGFPANLTWTGAAPEEFVSPNVIVTSIQLGQACDWPNWTIRKTDADGSVHMIEVDAGPATSPPPFPLVGTYEASPRGLTDPVAIAECDVTITLTLRCKK